MTRNKRLENISTSDDSDFDGDYARQTLRCKRNAPSPPPTSFRSQKNKAEKNAKGSKQTRIEISLNKLEKKNHTMLTSHQNTKSRKDILLTKIRQTKKETSTMDKKETSVIIESARQKQKCLIEDNVSENIVSDVEENNDPNILRQDFSMKVKDVRKVLSESNAFEKTSARSISLETPSTSKDYTTYKYKPNK